MRNFRTLSLKRESLTELTTNELVSVNGGQQELTHLGCNPTNECGHGPSFDERCPTLPINVCTAPFVASTLLDCVGT
jgi:hypothetical protein